MIFRGLRPHIIKPPGSCPAMLKIRPPTPIISRDKQGSVRYFGDRAVQYTIPSKPSYNNVLAEMECLPSYNTAEAYCFSPSNNSGSSFVSWASQAKPSQGVVSCVYSCTVCSTCSSDIFSVWGHELGHGYKPFKDQRSVLGSLAFPFFFLSFFFFLPRKK